MSTVASTTDEKSDQSELTTVEVGDAKQGMALAVPVDGGLEYFEVAHVEPIDDEHDDLVLLVFRGGQFRRYVRTLRLRLLSAEEWREHRKRQRDVRRAEVAARVLCALAADISAGTVPVPEQGVTVVLSYSRNTETMRRAAAALGAEVTQQNRSLNATVEHDHDREDVWSALTVTMTGYLPADDTTGGAR